ncbi:hypothetical protein ASAP_2736 [Asaia bogorensis]|uniref:Uncharacterized protein n=1 Tax=Asaia bogorensis TaxID=91915 RepID=A0A060QLI6_9PROT|nr:hypothetical protein ASAP_2736 [Asaia bogorensis]
MFVSRLAQRLSAAIPERRRTAQRRSVLYQAERRVCGKSAA